MNNVRWFAIALLLALEPSQSRATSIDRLYCGGSNVTADITYVTLRKIALNGDHLRIWLERVVPHNTPEENSWGIGYQLDRSSITGVLPLQSPNLTLILSFSHLENGSHRLRIGLITPDGRLPLYGRYCFSSPGHFIAD